MCFEIWSHCSRITRTRSINCPKSKRSFKDSATVSRASSKVPTFLSRLHKTVPEPTRCQNSQIKYLSHNSEKKGKRQELVEFDRLLTNEARAIRKNEVYYINEDDKERKYTSKHLKRQQSKNDTSKPSFGTMNSASNEN
jgi:hypothetical protein